MVVDLQCEPSESEVAWKKLGFIEIPEELDRRFHNKHLYKIIVPSLETNQGDSQAEVIELWYEEDYMAFKGNPDMRWNLLFKTGTRELITPIICPCIGDWGIKWVKDNNVLFKSRAKYFHKDGSNVINNFLIIMSLPAI